MQTCEDHEANAWRSLASYFAVFGNLYYPNRCDQNKSQNLTQINVFHKNGAHKCQNVDFDLTRTAKLGLPWTRVVFIVRHDFQMENEQPIRKEKQQNELHHQWKRKSPTQVATN